MGFEKEKLRQRINAGNFIDNNGSVLRAINVLHCRYNKLKDIEYALDIAHDELVDSVNYLHESGYINLRDRASKQESTLADGDFCELEAKLSAQGIRLIAGKLHDDCIDI